MKTRDLHETDAKLASELRYRYKKTMAIVAKMNEQNRERFWTYCGIQNKYASALDKIGIATKKTIVLYPERHEFSYFLQVIRERFLQ